MFAVFWSWILFFLYKKTSLCRNRVINQIHYSKFLVFGDFSCCDSLVEIHPSIDFSKFHATETMLLIDGCVLGGCWGLIRLSPYTASDLSIGTTQRGTDLRERPKVVFLAFAYSHIRSSSSRWVSHLQNNSCKTPGPVLISTSVFLKQSNHGKFRTHFGHGSAALTKIHERTGPTAL